MDLGINDKMTDPKRLLLLDGIGAIISATMLGGVLVYYQEYIGMPKHILYTLALVAICLATFSLSNYYRKSSEPRRALRIIGLVNILYGITSLGLMLFYYPILKYLGVAYFFVEKIIVFTLAYIELKVGRD